MKSKKTPWKVRAQLDPYTIKIESKTVQSKPTGAFINRDLENAWHNGLVSKLWAVVLEGRI